MDVGSTVVVSVGIFSFATVTSAWLLSRAVRGHILERRFDSPAEVLTDEQMAAMSGMLPTPPVQSQYTYDSARRAFENGGELPEADTAYSA